MATKKRGTRSEHRGPVIENHKGHEIIDCKVCKFKHVNPIPTGQEINDFYARFYTDEKPNYFKDAEEDLEWWLAGYRNYYTLFEKYTKGRKLLDIGSGPGYFLKCGADRGWEIVGFEPSKHAYDYSTKMGLKVINDYFNMAKAKALGKFDVVSLTLVLEHLPNPKKLIEEAKSILNPGGLLLILSPNEFNPLQRAVIKSNNLEPWWVCPPEHINYFDFPSIKKLVKSTGLKIVDSLATYPMELFLLNGEIYISNREIGRGCHKKRKSFEMNLYQQDPEILNNLYRSFARNNIGREFIIIAKKNEK